MGPTKGRMTEPSGALGKTKGMQTPSRLTHCASGLTRSREKSSRGMATTESMPILRPSWPWSP